MIYARRTKVPADRSRHEIETILIRYGASKFGYMTDDRQAMIGFEAHNRRLRFILPLPERSKKSEMRWAQEVRQRWRALLLTIKAKLESVQTGITTFEDEFLPYTLLPDGKTVSEWLQPQISAAYSNGRMPPLLLTSGNETEG